MQKMIGGTGYKADLDPDERRDRHWQLRIANQRKQEKEGTGQIIEKKTGDRFSDPLLERINEVVFPP